MDGMLKVQNSINLGFASLTPDIKRIQTSHVELAELDSNNENLISYVSLPFMISTVHLGNRLDEFIGDSTDSNEANIEATQITSASIETLKPLFLALIEACRTNYDSKINYQEWMLCILLIVAALLTIIWYIIAIYTMLDIINKKHNILATFSYVTPNEIEKIIETAQKVSIRDAKWNSALIEFRDIDNYSFGDKEILPSPVKTKSKFTGQPSSSTQDVFNQTKIVGDEMKEADIEMINKIKIQHKYDYIKYSE